MSYTGEQLSEAVKQVKDNQRSMRAVSRDTGIPYQTIRNHVKGISESHTRGPKPKLHHHEKDIKEACDTLVGFGYGLKKSDMKKLASEVCETAKIKPFKNGVPSDKWFSNFKKRNNMTLRTPQNCSAARLEMSTEEVKDEFFSTLRNVYDDLLPRGLDSNTIWNWDECGVSTVMESGKVVCTVGTKFVRARKSAERGENVTVLAAVNASGSQILPPMFIFRGKHISEDCMKDGMDGALFAYSAKSFIDSELFYLFFKKFLESAPPKRPILVIIDGHGSHLSLAVIQLAKNNDIHLLCLPPHTTHLYQPLDRVVFGAFKTALSDEHDKLLRKNKKRSINKNDIVKIVTPAWRKTVTPANIVSGFQCAGLWPFNPNAVQLVKETGKSSSRSSVTTNLPLQNNEAGTSSPSPAQNIVEEENEENLQETYDDSMMRTCECERVENLDFNEENGSSEASATRTRRNVKSVYMRSGSRPLNRTGRSAEPCSCCASTSHRDMQPPRKVSNTGKVPVIVNTPRASEVRSAPTRSILGLHTNNQNFDRFGLRDISNTNSAEQRSTVPIVTSQPQVDSDKENPVVSVIKAMFTPSQTQPEKPSRRVTKTRLLTSSEFVSELQAKNEVKRKKEEEKLERLRQRELKKKEREMIAASKAKNKNNKNKKRKRKADSESEDSIDMDDPEAVMSNSDKDEEEEGEEEELCGVCKKSFQNDFNGEEWIKCKSCIKWYHMGCVNLTIYNASFICDSCSKPTSNKQALRRSTRRL